jgi:hypothetical protein
MGGKNRAFRRKTTLVSGPTANNLRLHSLEKDAGA